MTGSTPLRVGMAGIAAAVERELNVLLAIEAGTPERLIGAMRYATLNAGKRLRPFLVHAAAALGEADPRAVTRVGAAIELVHCYSLVHDDLPAMDDADLRRGKPACHKAYDEPTAILVGDALNALAFAALAAEDWPCAAALRVRLVAGLARASGMQGMCGGQMLDLLSGADDIDEPGLAHLQALKTGALIAFALDAGASLAGLDDRQQAGLARYAEALGLAFQIQDDVLDLETSGTGKSGGRDAALGKTTFVTLLGIDGSRQRLAKLRNDGLAALTEVELATPLLGELFDFVITRRS